MTEDEAVQKCLDTLHSLETEKIVNFTGISNTELKLTYGAANLKLLMEYDQNYTSLVQTLETWSDTLYQAGFEADACTILEYAVSIHTDISASYYRLSQFYLQHGTPEKIEGLIQTASTLNSVMRDSIVRTLRKSCP